MRHPRTPAASPLSNPPEPNIAAGTLGAGAAAGECGYASSGQPATARGHHPVDDPTGSTQRDSDGQEGQTDHRFEEQDFTVFDESNLQDIAFFSAETPAPTRPAEPLPQDVFTNRFDLKGQDPGAVTVVLFDSLNTSFQDQAYVREQVITFLKRLQPPGPCSDLCANYTVTSAA